MSGNHEARVLQLQAVKEPKDKEVMNWKRRARADQISPSVERLLGHDGKSTQGDYLGDSSANDVGQAAKNLGISSKKRKSGSGVTVADLQPRQSR